MSAGSCRAGAWVLFPGLWKGRPGPGAGAGGRKGRPAAQQGAAVRCMEGGAHSRGRQTGRCPDIPTSPG